MAVHSSARVPQQERAHLTRARLLDATLETLVAKGYAGTSTNEVCRRAQLSRGTQLHHFPSKAALVGAAIEHLFERRLAELRARLDEVGDAAGRITHTLQFMLAIYTGPTLAAWIELVVASRTDAELRAQIVAVEARFFAQAKLACRELLGPGLDEARVATTTRLLLSVFDGLALHHMVARDRAAIDAVVTMLEPLLRHALEEPS